MAFDRNRPFNDLPLLPPETDLESKTILKQAIDANRELAELKGAGDAIPNQAVLVNSIVLQEARGAHGIAQGNLGFNIVDKGVHARHGEGGRVDFLPVHL